MLKNRYSQWLIFTLILTLAGGCAASSQPLSPQQSRENEMKRIARQGLERLERSFEKKEFNDFMGGLDRRFRPEQIPRVKQRVLNRFDRVDQIDINIVEDNIEVYPPKQRVIIHTHWQRRWNSKAVPGLQLREGRTVFIFHIEGRHARLIDTRGDRLFG